MSLFLPFNRLSDVLALFGRRYGVSEDRLSRIETALAELPTKADLADLRNAIAPPSVSGVGEIVRAQDRGSDLHFQTGIRGKLARFFVARRAAGDSVDATIVLPCLIFLTLVWLVDTGRINVSQSVTLRWGLFIPAGLAGCWMGVCLGGRGIGRAILRGILVGAFEGAAFPGLIKAAASQSDWLKLAVILMWANSLWFWIGAMFGSAPSDILIQTEEEWQKAAPRREFIRRIIRLALRLEDLKGESIPVAYLGLCYKVAVAAVTINMGHLDIYGRKPADFVEGLPCSYQMSPAEMPGRFPALPGFLHLVAARPNGSHRHLP
jgi:hypothetical protein